MKKNLLLLFSILFSLAIKVSADPVFKWGAFIKTDTETSKGIAAPVDVIKNANDEVFVFGNFGSTFKTQTDYTSISTYYLHNDLGSLIFERDTPVGASYGVNTTQASNSANTNIYVYKLDSDGKIVWQVTSNEGNVLTEKSSITTTQDGGVFLALKVCHTNSGENGDVMLRLLDNDGVTANQQSLTYTQSTYQGFLAKINNAGQVTNLLRVAASTDVVTDGFQFNSVVEDPTSGNIYLAGSFVVPLTFQKAGGGNVTLDPNFDYTGWNKDYVQYPRGYPFIVKLNANGELLEDFTPIIGSGTVAYSTLSSIDVDASGNLYVYGNLSSAEGTTLNLGDKVITQAISSKTESFAAKIAPTGSVDWVTHFSALLKTATAGGRNKITNLTYNSDSNTLLLCGAFSGPIGDADKNVLLDHTNTGTSLQGFILKLDASTGQFQKATSFPVSGISEATIAMSLNNKIYSVGYNMSVGQYLISYDSNLENPTAPFILIGGGATSWAATISNGLLLAYGRARGTVSFNSEAQFSMTYPAFNSALAAYVLEPSTTVLEDAVISNAIVYVSGDKIIVESAKKQLVQIYNLYGQLVTKEYVDGIATFEVPKGVYIVNGVKVIVP